jgi:hypothetical protein
MPCVGRDRSVVGEPWRVVRWRSLDSRHPRGLEVQNDHASLDIGDQRPTSSESESSVTVKPHPGPPSIVSLRRPTASKEARMTYSAVHNLLRHVI